MVGPCTTATTFSSSGLQLESHRCSQPSKKIYFRPGLYHLSFLPVLPATAAFTVAEGGTRMTEPSVSQQVSRDTTAALPLTNLPFRNNASRSPPTLSVGEKCSRPTASNLGLARTPAALSFWRLMPANEARDMGRMGARH